MIRTCSGASLHGPRLGDRLLEKPFFGIDNLDRPLPCTVVYVNQRHGWYTVHFDAGYRQSYPFQGGTS